MSFRTSRSGSISRAMRCTAARRSSVGTSPERCTRPCAIVMRMSSAFTWSSTASASCSLPTRYWYSWFIRPRLLETSLLQLPSLRGSVELDVGRLDDFRVFRHFRFHQPLEIERAHVVRGLRAVALELLFHVRRKHDVRQFH